MSAGDGGASASPPAERTAELAGSLAALRTRLAAAASAAGRDPGEITLIAVTKTFPASDVVALARLGVGDVGENRDQEAREKVAALAGAGEASLRWHFVGQLQTNKARSVAGYASAVHSVDRPALVTALAGAVDRAGRAALDVFVQVDLGQADRGRGGAPADTVPALAEAVLAAGGLRLRGVMAVAPLGVDPDAAFARLAEVSSQVQSLSAHASAISAGMSGDLEAAVRHGATHVRIGSALLGHRSPHVG